MKDMLGFAWYYFGAFFIFLIIVFFHIAYGEEINGVIGDSGTSTVFMVAEPSLTLDERIVRGDIVGQEIVDEIDKIKVDHEKTEVLLSQYAQRMDFIRSRYPAAFTGK